MATHQVTGRKREQLRAAIRTACESGALQPGQMVPTIRELQSRYALSSRIVHEELRKLVADGILVSRPRVGIFVADREVTEPDTYLMVVPSHPEVVTRPEAVEQVRAGFEDQITELGGATVVLAVDFPLVARLGSLPTVVGVFGAGAKDAGELRGVIPDDVPRVRWQTVPTDPDQQPGLDTVAPDLRGAGRRATEYLMRRGHRRVGFLGLHALAEDSPQINHWSALAESGWAAAVRDAGHDPDDLVFRVKSATDRRDAQLGLAEEAARPLVARRDISAVVCANTKATEGLIAALRAAGVPADSWPALVTVGDTIADVSAFTTGVRIPYDQLGRRAALMLWARVHGEERGRNRHEVVTMPMVRRADHDHEWIELATQRKPVPS